MSSTKLTRQAKYDQFYPQYLPWQKAQWIVEKDDLVKMNEQEYKVSKVIRFPIPGKLPQIVLEEMNND